METYNWRGVYDSKEEMQDDFSILIEESGWYESYPESFDCVLVEFGENGRVVVYHYNLTIEQAQEKLRKIINLPAFRG